MKPSHTLIYCGLFVAFGALQAACLSRAPSATATLPRPTPRPTFPFPPGTAVPVTSAEDVIIESEPGPLYVILSTVDEHGLLGEPEVSLMSRPDPADMTPVGAVRSGTFAQVLEIRRLPPDYLRGFYRVRVNGLVGWVGEYLAHRTVFVIVFDAQGCACPGQVPLFSDAALTQLAGSIPNRSPLRLLALEEKAVQVLILADGRLGWVSRELVHESDENEFLKHLAPQ